MAIVQQTSVAAGTASTDPANFISTFGVTFSAAAAGNVLIAVLATDKNAGVITTPSGWTLIGSEVNNNVSLAMYYKVAAGGETSVTFAWTTAIRMAWGHVQERDDITVTGLTSGTSTSGNSNVTSLATASVSASDDAIAIAAWAVDSCTAYESGSISGQPTWSNSFTRVAGQDDTAGTIPSGNNGFPGTSVATRSVTAGSYSTTATWFSPDQASTVLAIFPAAGDPPPPPTAALEWSVPGAVTPSGATIAVRTDIATTDVKVRYSTNSDLTAAGWVETAAQATSSGDYFTTKFALTGLAANTTHHYAPGVDGVLATAAAGRFTTFPASGSPWSGVIAFGSCRESNSTNAVFGRIAAKNPAIFLDLGDLHYEDITTNSQSLFHAAFDISLGNATQNALYRTLAYDYVPDDHDSAQWSGIASAAAAQAAYRTAIPHHMLPDAAGLYHSFVVGRVRVIMTDLRTLRDATDADGFAAETMMGATQKAWFKAECLAAKAAGQAIIWGCSIPWAGVVGDGIGFDDDGWAHYPLERRELADFFYDNGLVGRMVLIFGDTHALVYDDGSNSNYRTGAPVGEKAFPMFAGSAIHRFGSIKGQPYTDYYDGGGSTVTNYGTLTVADSGGSSLTITYRGYRYQAGSENTWRTEVATLAVLDATGAAALTSPVPAVALTGTAAPGAVAGAMPLASPAPAVAAAGLVVNPRTGAAALTSPAPALTAAGTAAPLTVAGATALTSPVGVPALAGVAAPAARTGVVALTSPAPAAALTGSADSTVDGAVVLVSPVGGPALAGTAAPAAIGAVVALASPVGSPQLAGGSSIGPVAGAVATSSPVGLIAILGDATAPAVAGAAALVSPVGASQLDGAATFTYAGALALTTPTGISALAGTVAVGSVTGALALASPVGVLAIAQDQPVYARLRLPPESSRLRLPAEPRRTRLR